MSNMICEGCRKKVGYLFGNAQTRMWLCDDCDLKITSGEWKKADLPFSITFKRSVKK